MKFIEKFSGVFLLAGVFLFFGATLSLGIVPAVMVDRVHPRQGLPDEVPYEFKKYYASAQQYGDALLAGRDVYVAEGCWHCHSQYVRPVGNETLRYGPVSTPGEYNTVLHLPQMLGTRRVGPDLSRVGGVYSNDWHFAHLWDPQSTVPDSVMPRYPWLFEVNASGVPIPNEKGVAVVAYIQHLGHEFKGRAMSRWDHDAMILPPSDDLDLMESIESRQTTTGAEDEWE
jgi:cbb3-type cytochrome c oxidase subunit II